MFIEEDYQPDDLDVRVSELLVATADSADAVLEPQVQEVLSLLRHKLGMDVVFVSEFCNGQRVFRAVEQVQPTLAVGGADPLEESWCQRVVDGRLPQLILDAAPLIESGDAPPPGIPIGSHLSTPIVMKDGQVYGTLCCFSHHVNGATNRQDLDRLRYTANLLASKLRSSS